MNIVFIGIVHAACGMRFKKVLLVSGRIEKEQMFA